MRRFMSLLMAASFLASMAGCTCFNPRGSCDSSRSCNSSQSCGLRGSGHGLTQGICDCESDDHCLERAPWLCNHGAPTAGETIVAPAANPPAKMPDGKKL